MKEMVISIESEIEKQLGCDRDRSRSFMIEVEG
jgi:hypothetical protein